MAAAWILVGILISVVTVVVHRIVVNWRNRRRDGLTLASVRKWSKLRKSWVGTISVRR